jgi:SAM-dependent methyltransferase
MDELRERLQLDFERFTFVDAGSGKGRALLLASDYPFREIIGVELSPELDRIARANIARYTARRPHPPVVSVLGDAAEFEWPSGPLIVYMWNAFTRPVMEQVFENLQAWFARDPQELYLIYMHPELESTVSEHPWLTRLWREEFIMSEEDYSAWAFPTRAEVCAVYSTKVTKTR